MIKYALTLLVALALATTASAASDLVYSSNDLGGGLTEYIFSISETDGLSASYGADLTFTTDGTIQQLAYVPAFGPTIAPDFETEATNYDGAPGYTKQGDTWIYDPFTIPSGVGYVNETSNSWAFIVVSPSGSTLGDGTNLTHIVTDGDLWWEGSLARGGVDYAISGTTVPEPATMSLLGLGGLALLRRRRA